VRNIIQGTNLADLVIHTKGKPVKEAKYLRSCTKVESYYLLVSSKRAL
jgi:hypothetical protein